MAPAIKTIATFAALASLINLSTCAIGKTTRYWDCCKPYCAEPSKGQTAGTVKVCDSKDKEIDSDPNSSPLSACEPGGTAYACSSQTPWAINSTLAYGFTAISMKQARCCQCYKLTFTEMAVQGQTMIVQATNVGSDVGDTQFDLAIPGGGFGLFDACTNEWGATSDVWGVQYGGMDKNRCKELPEPLQQGCGFRFDWMKGASNPQVEYEEVPCPKELTDKTGCGIPGNATHVKIRGLQKRLAE